MTEFDKVIPPGGVGKVSAVIHTTTFKGPVSKSVTVTTNDPDKRTFSLTLKANVTVPIDIQPSENVSFNGKWNALQPQVLTMASADASVFDIISATPSDPAFQAKVVAAPVTGTAPKPKSGTIASGANRYQVTITASDTVPIGRVNATLTLKTSHPKASDQVIRIFGTVTGDVEMVPSTVSLSVGASAPPEAKVQHVIIRKAGGTPLKILQVAADNPQVSTALKTVKEGQEYDLEVKYAGPAMTTALSSKITVRTNDPRQPTIELPVWGRTDPPAARPAAGGAKPVQVLPAPSKVPPSP